jgi:hypothetical protein
MRGRAALAVVAAACLLLGACSEDETTPKSSATTPTGPAREEPTTCPLTGRKVPTGVDVSRPAVAVKVENSAAARPQSGLERADLVFEEIVEGGITRFMAVYHCGDAKKVGPVRSARFDDPKIALPFTRVLAYSGSNSIVERELKKRRIISLDELDNSGAFFRVPPGTLEIHNLFTNVVKLRAAARSRRPPPPGDGLFEFGAIAGKPPKARAVEVRFAASNSIEYRWKGGRWRRWEDGAPFKTASGKQIAVPNVLVQQVEVNNSKKIVDAAGNASPDIALDGRGRAWLFRDGRVIAGTWKVGRAGGRFEFETRAGKPFVFDKGPIWIELVPSPKGAVRGSVTIST